VFMSLVRWGDTSLQNGPAPRSFVDADTGQTVEVRERTSKYGTELADASPFVGLR
jgi:hypothetical protein